VVNLIEPIAHALHYVASMENPLNVARPTLLDESTEKIIRKRLLADMGIGNKADRYLIAGK